MEQSRSHKYHAASDFGPYLPGMDDCAFTATRVSAALMDHDRLWVRSSAKQVLNAAGQLAGFEHKLMRGSKTILTGIGPDTRRTFEAQADFLNQAKRTAQSDLLSTAPPDFPDEVPDNLGKCTKPHTSTMKLTTVVGDNDGQAMSAKAKKQCKSRIPIDQANTTPGCAVGAALFDFPTGTAGEPSGFPESVAVPAEIVAGPNDTKTPQPATADESINVNTAGKGEAETVDVEVIPAGKSLGRAKAKGKKVTQQDLADFQRLHQIILRCGEMFVDVGNALREIRDRELYRAAGFPNWNAYTECVQNITKRYANLLISTAEAVVVMREVGNKFPTAIELVPHAPTQVIPLLRIKDSDLRRVAWNTAVERSDGKQPRSKLVSQVVADILERQDNPANTAPPPIEKPRAERRTEVMGRMKAAVEAREDWDLVGSLVLELEALLRCRASSARPNAPADPITPAVLPDLPDGAPQ